MLVGSWWDLLTTLLNCAQNGQFHMFNVNLQFASFNPENGGESDGSDNYGANFTKILTGGMEYFSNFAKYF